MNMTKIVAVAASLSFGLGVSIVAQTPAPPSYRYDPGWPKLMPNKWKIGGVTGLAVAPNDDFANYQSVFQNILRSLQLNA